MSNTEDYNEFENENFEEMLEQSLSRSDNFMVGDKVKGKIIIISDGNVFIDISGKSEAFIELNEFIDAKGNYEIKEGDELEAYVVSTSGGEIILTTSIGRGNTNIELLQMAYENEIPISGLISKTTKGGYNVAVSNINCFCPFSQFDIKKVANPDELINKRYTFKIIQFGERGKNIILSRRVLLEEKIKANEDMLKESLNEGDEINGEISSIRDFGIFIDIGGIEALVPKSEISWSRHIDLKQFEVGQTILSKVKSIDWDNKKITLSIKDMTSEPWSNIGNYSPNSKVKGKVVNIIKNGAFIELEPGIEGYLHISNMSYVKRIKKPEDAVSIGQEVTVKIQNINEEEKKISLELLTGETDPWQIDESDLLNEIHTGIIEISKSAGINVRLSNGMLGFIPKRELANSDKDIQKEYKTGREIKCTVIELDKENKNLILSESGAHQAEELKDFKKFQDKNAPDENSSLGSLFKNQFEKIQKDIDKQKK